MRALAQGHTWQSRGLTLTPRPPWLSHRLVKETDSSSTEASRATFMAALAMWYGQGSEDGEWPAWRVEWP